MNTLYIYLNNEQQGPYNKKEIEDLLLTKQITMDSLSWDESANKWVPLAYLIGTLTQVKPSLPPLLPGKAVPPSATGSNIFKYIAATICGFFLVLFIIIAATPVDKAGDSMKSYDKWCYEGRINRVVVPRELAFQIVTLLHERYPRNADKHFLFLMLYSEIGTGESAYYQEYLKVLVSKKPELNEQAKIFLQETFSDRKRIGQYFSHLLEGDPNLNPDDYILSQD